MLIPLPCWLRLVMLAVLVATILEPSFMVRVIAVVGIHFALLPIYGRMSPGLGWGYAGFGLALATVLV